jgi:hypothetical protein
VQAAKPRIETSLTLGGVKTTFIVDGGAVFVDDDEPKNQPQRSDVFSPTSRTVPEVPFQPGCGPPSLPYNYNPSDAAIRAGVDALPNPALELIAQRNGTTVAPAAAMPESHILVPQPPPSQNARYQMMLEELQKRHRLALEMLERDIV